MNFSSIQSQEPSSFWYKKQAVGQVLKMHQLDSQGEGLLLSLLYPSTVHRKGGCDYSMPAISESSHIVLEVAPGCLIYIFVFLCHVTRDVMIRRDSKSLKLN